MNIELEDAENNRLSCTFWGEFVEQIVPQLLTSDNQPVVVALQLIQAHKFQDSYTVCNTWNASKLWINPTDVEFEEFKKLLLTVHHSNFDRITHTISQQNNSVLDELSNGTLQVKTISKLLKIGLSRQKSYQDI
ncbi:hypothetical protein P3L10_034573 [Capsicum annuum]